MASARVNDSYSVEILRQAVMLDEQGSYEEAIEKYSLGIQQLLEIMKASKDNDTIKKLRESITKYLTRAENIKKMMVRKKYHEHIEIKDNDVGYGYEKLFSKYFSNDVNFVNIRDPYIRSFYQIQNLVKFVEVIIKHGRSVTDINLMTIKSNSEESFVQEKNLYLLAQNLKEYYNVNLNITYSTTLHDRAVVLSNGVTMRLGRGLDYFKPARNNMFPGFYDLDLRCCHETSIDVFYD